jgi:hypothetical protein
MTDTPGVQSWNLPADAAKTVAAFERGKAWTGRHVASPTPFDGRPHDIGLPEGRPSGTFGDVPLEQPLPDLVDVQEAPTLADTVADHGRQLADLGARLDALETNGGMGPWND